MPRPAAEKVPQMRRPKTKKVPRCPSVFRAPRRFTEKKKQETLPFDPLTTKVILLEVLITGEDMDTLTKRKL